MSIKQLGWKWFHSTLDRKMVLARPSGDVVCTLKYETLEDLINSGAAASIPREYDLLFDAVAEYKKAPLDEFKKQLRTQEGGGRHD